MPFTFQGMWGAGMMEEGREKIRRTAERLRESAIWVSARTVYDALGRKGSYNAMDAVVADWRAEIEYRPEIECHDLPAALKVRLLDIGSEILGQVRAEQAATLDVERSNAEARRRAYETKTAEATAMVEQLPERVRDLQAEVAHLSALNGIEGAHAPGVGLPVIAWRLTTRPTVFGGEWPYMFMDCWPSAPHLGA